MTLIDEAMVSAFLAEAGARHEIRTDLFLLGGGGLLLLGSKRYTLDLDYVGNNLISTDLDATLTQVAYSMGLQIEAVPNAEFVPVVPNAESRQVYLGRFGQLETYFFDPYTIALSKLDRGFESDLDDIVFLIDHGYVEFSRLKAVALEALTLAQEFDLDKEGIQTHLATIKELLGYGTPPTIASVAQ